MVYVSCTALIWGQLALHRTNTCEKLMTKENRDKVDEIIEKVKGEVEMSDTSGMTTEELEKTGTQ